MTSQQPNIALVIPCYNEERRLRTDAFIDELSKNPNLTFLFVNDGSKDNTLGVIKKICASNPTRALCLSLDKNSGKGEAVRRGMLYLSEKGLYNIIGFWDADLAVPLLEILELAGVFRQNSNVRVVIGSRVHLAGRLIEHVNIRHYAGRLFATIMCWSFHFKIYDTQCGAKLFDSKVLLNVLHEPFHSKWIFDVELIIRIYNLPFLKGHNNWLSKESWLYESPVREWRNVAGTKRSFSAYSAAFFDYLTLVRKYLF